MDNKKPQITLAICTCNRTGLLTKLLKSIQVSKPCDIANIEVLIVDNHKSHSAINVVQNMSDFKYSLHYISGERAGVPYARNTACEWCVSRSGEAIIFVDDDELVSEHWLASLIKYYLTEDEICVVQGRTDPIFEQKAHPSIPTDLFAKSKPDWETGKKLSVASTNNVIFSLAPIKKHGLLFDERQALTGGSDYEFFVRVNRLGYQIRWCKEALTYEFIAKTRASIFWLIARHFRYGCTRSLITLNELDYTSAVKLQFKLFIKSFKKLCLLLRDVDNYPFSLVRATLIKVEMLGLLAGLIGINFKEYSSRHK